MGHLKSKLVYSRTTDPWYNLALEEYLLNGVGENEVILYLWQNDNTVVIGRNQNAWKECRYKQLEEDGGKLARRLSGGGAVFHDLGNLNFTFVMDRKLYDLKKQLKVILGAVKEMGIEARFSGRNDLIADGRKFSGNAFYFSGQGAYHHGTILVDTDFSKLVTYLQVSKEKIKSKGIESVRSRVINLKELNKDLTITKMREAMTRSFTKIYMATGDNDKEGLEKEVIGPSSLPLDELYQKYSSWDWRFGQSPEFDLSFEHRFEWGGLEVGFNLKNGIIEKATIYSDAMDSTLIKDIADSLKGIPLSQAEIVERINSLPTDSEGQAIVRDITDWLSTRDI